MRSRKQYVVALCGALLLLAQGAEALAHMRLTIGPWWPVPIVVAPIPPGPPIVPPPPPPPPQPPFGGPPVGFVDTDVHPKDAAVRVDGQHRGIVDAFDGVPAYLELAPGRHRIEFAREGFEPVAVVVGVNPGQVVSVDLALRPLRDAAPPAEQRTYQLETEGTGFLELDIEPGDAAVYIDGAFYGPALQFREAGQRVVLRAGAHTIEIGRPGYMLYRGTVTVVAAETTPLKITLEK